MSTEMLRISKKSNGMTWQHHLQINMLLDLGISWGKNVRKPSLDLPTSTSWKTSQSGILILSLGEHGTIFRATSQEPADLLLTLWQARKLVLKAAANASPWAPQAHAMFYMFLARMSLRTYLGNNSSFLVYLLYIILCCPSISFPIAAVLLTMLPH